LPARVFNRGAQRSQLAGVPGPVDTPMTERITNNKGLPGRKDFEAFVPMRRYAVPEEIANAVLWLCSASHRT
jgi:NAD(P)-dependent dehydrogenase (short-subunit alcohol dehydrogenase family)